jgi:hypothetical protein
MKLRLNLRYLLHNEKFAYRSIGKMGREDNNLPGTDKVTSGTESPSTALEDTRQGFVSIGVTESHSCNNAALNCGRKLSGGKVYELCSLAIFELHHEFFKQNAKGTLACSQT